LVSAGILAEFYFENFGYLLPLVLAGAAIAAVGYIDDRKGLSAKFRLLIQLLAALLLVFSQTGYLSASLFPGFPASAVLNGVLLVLFILWMTNLFNFMDGIDGLAGGQAFSVALIIAFLLGNVQEDRNVIYYLCLVLSGSSLGFLFVNWSPAKIFMGDVGSGFIGFWIAGLTVLGVLRLGLSPMLFFIPMTVFIVDSTYTLIRRCIRGAKPTEAHRENAYQVLVRGGKRHSSVSMGVILFNFLVLGPITYYFLKNSIQSFAIVIILYLVLSAVPFALGAGKKEESA